MKKFVVSFIISCLVVGGCIIGYSLNNQAVSKCTIEQVQKGGCCSRHGGVCGCSKDHRAKCCDGSLSPTCGC